MTKRRTFLTGLNRLQQKWVKVQTVQTRGPVRDWDIVRRHPSSAPNSGSTVHVSTETSVEFF
jgi:hypothetical protein